ncbi:hypothetical protein P3W45_001409 [Vairimorpha bombi]|jgi:hypothetical protein
MNPKKMRDYKKTDNMKDFEIWMEDIALVYNNLCKLYQDMDLVRENTGLEIRLVPKCLVQLTKEMCKCNLDCMANSFNLNILSHNCFLYDLNNLFLSMEHKDCAFLEKKVVNEELVELETDFYDSIGEEIGTGIEKLCDDMPDSFEELQCKMYELKEGCRGIEDCYKYILSSEVNRSCKNPDFVDQIEDIRRSIQLPENIFNSIREKRSTADKANNFIQNNLEDVTYKKNEEIFISSRIKDSTLKSGSSMYEPSFIIPLSSFIVFLFVFSHLNNSKFKTKKSITIFVGASMTLLILCCVVMNNFI